MASCNIIKYYLRVVIEADIWAVISCYALSRSTYYFDKKKNKYFQWLHATAEQTNQQQRALDTHTHLYVTFLIFSTFLSFSLQAFFFGTCHYILILKTICETYTVPCKLMNNEYWTRTNICTLRFLYKAHSLCLTRSFPLVFSFSFCLFGFFCTVFQLTDECIHWKLIPKFMT